MEIILGWAGKLPLQALMQIVCRSHLAGGRKFRREIRPVRAG